MAVALVLSYWHLIAESKSSFSLFYDERADLDKGTDLEMPIDLRNANGMSGGRI